MTRREQFRKSKRKHKRREQRNWEQHSRPTPNQANNTHGGGKPLNLPKLGRTPGLKYGTGGGYLSPTLTGTSVPYTLTLGDAWGEPPHVRITDPGYRFAVAAGKHPRNDKAGYHQRGFMKYGRKQGRMGGTQRAAYFAQGWAWVNGYYPDWDPKGRHPTAVDIDNGADYVTGDPRWGYTGEYP